MKSCSAPLCPLLKQRRYLCPLLHIVLEWMHNVLKTEEQNTNNKSKPLCQLPTFSHFHTLSLQSLLRDKTNNKYCCSLSFLCFTKFFDCTQPLMTPSCCSTSPEDFFFLFSTWKDELQYDNRWTDGDGLWREGREVTCKCPGGSETLWGLQEPVGLATSGRKS